MSRRYDERDDVLWMTTAPTGSRRAWSTDRPMTRYPGLPRPPIPPETDMERIDRQGLRVLQGVGEFGALLSGLGFGLWHSGVSPGGINAGIGAGLATLLVMGIHVFIAAGIRAERREVAGG